MLVEEETDLAHIFAKRGVILAYLFGSHARGEAGPLSDVDIAVLFQPDMPAETRFEALLKLMGDLAPFFDKEVEIVDLQDASPLLRHRVYYDGRLLYAAGEKVRIAFETKALRDYIDTQPLRSLKKKYILQRFK